MIRANQLHSGARSPVRSRQRKKPPASQSRCSSAPLRTAAPVAVEEGSAALRVPCTRTRAARTGEESGSRPGEPPPTTRVSQPRALHGRACGHSSQRTSWWEHGRVKVLCSPSVPPFPRRPPPACALSRTPLPSDVRNHPSRRVAATAARSHRYRARPHLGPCRGAHDARGSAGTALQDEPPPCRRGLRLPFAAVASLTAL
jgi:hypothetical protein